MSDCCICHRGLIDEDRIAPVRIFRSGRPDLEVAHRDCIDAHERRQLREAWLHMAHPRPYPTFYAMLDAHGLEHWHP